MTAWRASRTAEEHYSEGDLVQARIFALRARVHLPQNTPEYHRATDIALTSEPTGDDLKALAAGRLTRPPKGDAIGQRHLSGLSTTGSRSGLATLARRSPKPGRDSVTL